MFRVCSIFSHVLVELVFTQPTTLDSKLEFILVLKFLHPYMRMIFTSQICCNANWRKNRATFYLILSSGTHSCPAPFCLSCYWYILNLCIYFLAVLVSLLRDIKIPALTGLISWKKKTIRQRKGGNSLAAQWLALRLSDARSPELRSHKPCIVAKKKKTEKRNVIAQGQGWGWEMG